MPVTFADGSFGWPTFANKMTIYWVQADVERRCGANGVLCKLPSAWYLYHCAEGYNKY